MEDHVQLLCWELVAELAEAALNNPEVSHAPVESLPQANTLTEGAQNPHSTDPIAASPNTQSALPESKTEGPLKPQFFAKRPASAPLLPHPKVARGECESASIKRIEQQLKAVTSSLKFVSGERDHWRTATEEARRASERLAHENNRLAEESLELRGLAEEQGKACTLLAAELVEMVWSLTSQGPMETLHISNLSRIAKQALAQATTGSTPKEEQQLSIGLLGCLVNLTGELEGLKVLMQTEDGREVLRTSCLVVIHATEPTLAELAMMLLVNVLSSEHGLGTTDLKTILGVEFMTKVGVAAGRWRVGERGRGRLVEVAANLEAALAVAGAAIKLPPRQQQQEE